MKTNWKVNWDIGHACGTFPEIYDTEEEAEAAAEAIYADNIADGTWDEETCGAEAIAVEVADEDDEQEEPFDPKDFGWVGANGRP
jgi:hypothetical protein